MPALSEYFLTNQKGNQAKAGARLQTVQHSLDRTLTPSFFGSAGQSSPSASKHAQKSIAVSSNRTDEQLSFAIPDSEDIFSMHQTQKQKKADEVRTMSMLPVHKKTTFCARIQAAVPLDVAAQSTYRNPLRRERPSKDPFGGTVSSYARPEKESLGDFLAKKREMFLVQMELDTLESEINKLRESGSQREAALYKAEKSLDEDTACFNNFLKENADKLAEAMVKADLESRAKQEQIAKIKRVSTVIVNIRSEMARMEEQQEEARRLQGFLEQLTPPEWHKGLRNACDERHQQRMDIWAAECEAIKRKQQDAQAAKAKAEADYEGSRTQQEADRAQEAIKAASLALKDALAESSPPAPVKEEVDEDLTYFQEPQQLLDIFARMEGKNLTLIQNSQEAEQALEEELARGRSLRARLDAEAATLEEQVRQLQVAKDCQAAICAALKAQAVSESQATTPHTDSMNARPANELAAKVAQVYERCGFTRDHSLSQVQMLAGIEARLEACLTAVEALPPEVIEVGERAREKARRQTARETKRAQQEKEYQARMARAIERAAAPTFKRTGRVEMKRSILHRKATAQLSVSQAKAKADDSELDRYIAQEFP